MINQHTPGPLLYAGFIGEGKCNGTHSVDSKGRCVLDNPQPDGMPAAEGEANAKLSVAAFNQFDRAARALGVDAVELAKNIDLLELIQNWQLATKVLDTVSAEDFRRFTGESMENCQRLYKAVRSMA